MTTKDDLVERLTKENQEFRAACTKLWPAIRHFGLCGADVRYIEAVVAIGQILGVAGSATADTAELVAKARMETIDQVAEEIRQSSEVLALAGRGLREKLANAVAGMRVK